MQFQRLLIPRKIKQLKNIIDAKTKIEGEVYASEAFMFAMYNGLLRPIEWLSAFRSALVLPSDLLSGRPVAFLEIVNRKNKRAQGRSGFAARRKARRRKARAHAAEGITQHVAAAAAERQE